MQAKQLYYKQESNSKMSLRYMCNACCDGDIQAMEKILGREEVDLNTGYGYAQVTPLMLAMGHNHPSIVTRLLSIPHIRLDCTDTWGSTALHWACMQT